MKHAMKQRKMVKATLLIMAAVLAVSVAGVAWAQASNNYDMACWGALTSTTGLQTSNNFAAVAALGEPVIGRSTSANFSLNTGFHVDFTTLGTGVPDPGPEITPAGDQKLYMPFLSRMVRTVRTCGW